MATDGKKQEKKARKKEIAAFKKAFKKQTGLAVDSKDWSKLLAAFATQVAELKKWTAMLGKLQPAKKDDADKQLSFWLQKLAILNESSKKDMKWSGTTAREKLPVLLKIVETTRKAAKSKPATQKVGDRTVSIYPTDIPGFAELDGDQQNVAIVQAATRTANGLKLFESIADGSFDVDDPNLQVTPEQVEQLIWAFKSKAQEKNKGPYQKGAMTVPNGEKLRKFLDKCPEVYSRLSSHFREQQDPSRGVKGGVKVTNTKGGQTPRGMDFYNPNGDDKPGRLPAGMNALLFQQVVLPNGEVALYVKMETEGSFGHPGDNRKLDPTVPPDRAPHPNDSARARKHLKNLVIKEHGDTDLKGLREQTPKEVVEAIKAVVKAAEGKKAKAYLKSSYGTEINLITPNKAVPRISIFFKAYEDCQKRDGENGWELGDAAEKAMDNAVNVIHAKFPQEILEPERRMGEEVVLTSDDLAKPQDDQQPQPQQDDNDDDQDFDDFDDLGEDETDEDETDEDNEEGGVDLPQLALLCSQLAESVKDKQLKGTLQDLCFGSVLEAVDDGPFKAFYALVEKADPSLLGPQAVKLGTLLKSGIDRF